MKGTAQPRLVLDSNYLAHRVMFKVGHLSYEDKMTGVIFGFLKTLMELNEKFSPSEMIFCWDSIKSYRKILCPTYKSNRHNKDFTEEELKAKEICYAQFNELQFEILPRIGFANVFSQVGIEADDIIARVVLDQPLDNEYIRHIIVSADNDLFQMLSIADMYLIDKKLLFTSKAFTDQYDVTPSEWLKVKALMGDSSDNLPGIKGVGLINALKCVTGKNRSMKMAEKIQDNIDLVNLNEILMKIPHSRTKSVSIQKSKIDMFQFEQVCLENGFQWFLRKEQYDKWKRMFSSPGVSK